MFQGLIVDVAIIISYLFIIGQLSRYFHKRNYTAIFTALKTQLIAGCLFGLLGIILMNFSIIITDKVIVDLRHLAIVLAATFFSAPAAIIASIVIGIVRLIMGGFSDVSIGASLFMVFLGFLSAYLSKLPYKLDFMAVIQNVAGIVVVYISLYVNLGIITGDMSKLGPIFLSYWLISLFGGILSFLVAKYIFGTNQLFVELENTKLRLSTLITNLNSGIIVETPYRKIELVNKKYYEIFKIPYSLNMTDRNREEFIEEHLSEILKDKTKYLTRMNDLLEKKKVVLNEEIVLKDGRIIERDFIPIVSKEAAYIGHMWNYRDITVKKEAEQKLIEANEILQEMSNLDGLTRIPNRRFYDQMIQLEWDEAWQNQRSLSLIMLDIDQFKLYNDTYGHQQGDDCLKKVAQALKQCLKRPGDFIARYGGEEFSIILPDTDKLEAVQVGERLRAAIESLQMPNINSTVKPVVTISVGVASAIPVKEENYNQLVLKADQALYLAKESGRNQVRGSQSI